MSAPAPIGARRSLSLTLRPGLHAKLLLVVLLALVPLLVLQLTSAQDTFARRRALILDDVSRLARTVALLVDSTFDEAIAVGKAVANAPVVRSGDPARISGYLSDLTAIYTQYGTFVVFDERGELVGEARPGSPRSIADLPHFQLAMHTGQPAIARVAVGRRVNQPTSGVVVPISGADGQPQGVVVISLSFPELAAKLESVGLEPGQAISVLDPDARVAMLTRNPDLSWDARDQSASPYVRAALSGQSVVTTGFQSQILGDRRVLALTATPRHGWVVGVTWSEAEAFGPIESALRRDLLTYAAIALLAALAALGVAGLLVRPIRQLAAHARALSAGNLSARVITRTGDELDDLAHAFNELAAALERREAEVASQTARLVALAELSRGVSQAAPDEAAVRVAAAREVGEALGDACTVWILSADGQWLRPVATHHPDPDLRQAIQQVTGLPPQPADSETWRPVIAERATLRLDASTQPGIASAATEAAFVRWRPLRSILKAPLVARGRLFGAISLVRYDPGPAHTADDEAFVRDLADRVALAIDNARLVSAVRQAQERLMQALAAANATAWEWDLGTDELHTSGPMDAQLGRPEGTVVSHVTQSFSRVHPDDRARVMAALDDTLAERREFAEEFRVVGDDGAVRWLHGRGRLQQPENGRPLRMVGLVVDITARKDLEVLRVEAAAQEAATRLKDEIMRVVSHELRTPLASLVGFAELLLTREWPEARRRQFLQTMLREGQRLAALINDFLDLQRLEGGNIPLEAAPLDVRGLVERAAHMLGDDRLRPIVLDVPVDLPPALADADRIHQVLLNFLSNARKYSPDGGTITVSARATPAGQVEVRVTDQGLGLPAEALPKLFGTFYRVDSPERHEIHGTGLGLAIARRIVEAHGGRAWAESAGPGQGSTFGFTLPLADPTAAPTVPPGDHWTTESGLAGLELSPGGVLVVEDDAAYAEWLKQLLEASGYPTSVVASADEALREMTVRLPAVMLLDLRLRGGLDGWDLLAVLRNRPETHDLPVVVVSAYEEWERGQALDVAEYLVKPVQVTQLRSVLRRLGVSTSQAVLVVEDEPSTREMLLRQFERLGRPTRGVGTGREALSLLAAEPDAFGLVVLDLGLPDMDGLSVLDQIRAEPPTREVPVVIHTGQDLSPQDKRALAERAAEVVRKGNGLPIADAVARVLQQRATVGADPPRAR